MKTDLGQGVGKQVLLNMHIKDLQEKATVLSITIARIVTSKLQKGCYKSCGKEDLWMSLSSSVTK